MSHIILLTVEPHVESYIKKLFGSHLILSEDNVMTILLKKILEPFEKQDPSRVRPNRKYSLGGSIAIIISDGMLRKYGGYMSNENIKGFSKTVDYFIKQEMYRWCHHPNATDQIVDFNIKRFINFYDFAEDDLTFDNLKRWYYRERARIENRKHQTVTSGLEIPILLSTMPVVEIKQMNLFGE